MCNYIGNIIINYLSHLLLLEDKKVIRINETLHKNFNIDLSYVDGKGNTALDYARIYQAGNYEQFSKILTTHLP